MGQFQYLTINGNTYKVADPDAASIRDDVVGGHAWSAKNIVDRLCPSFTQTGSIVTCGPVEGYPLEVTGDGTVFHRGKNLIPQPYAKGTHIFYGVTFTVGEDYSITLDGDGTSEYVATFTLLGTGTGTNAALLSRTGIIPGETYTMSIGTACPSGVAVYVYWYTEGGDLLTSVSISTSSKTFTVPSNAGRIYMFIRVGAQIAVNGLTLYPMLEKGDAATAYERYRGEEFTESGAYTLTAYPGINTFYADGDIGVTVTGRADPVTVIEKLTNAIIALGGNV